MLNPNDARGSNNTASCVGSDAQSHVVEMRRHGDTWHRAALSVASPRVLPARVRGHFCRFVLRFTLTSDGREHQQTFQRSGIELIDDDENKSRVSDRGRTNVRGGYVKNNSRAVGNSGFGLGMNNVGGGRNCEMACFGKAEIEIP